MLCMEKKLSGALSGDIGKLILRVSLAGLMLFHGVKKLFGGIDGIVAMVNKAGLPEILAYGVYAGEVVFPLLIIFGLLTRVSAIGVAFTMVFAILLAFGDSLFALGKTGGLVIELPLFFLLASVSLVFLGAGKYSIDGKFKISSCTL